MATTGLLTLFIGSLLASTIVPGGVEVLLYVMAEQGSYSFSELLWVSTAGNTIGGCITFAMGWMLRGGVSRFRGNSRSLRWISDRFALEDSALQRVQKWGPAALLLSWMPIIGDPICVAGGFLRLPVWRSILMIAISKFARYWILLYFLF
ncbi:MAG: DedA family protein [Pseudomonadota bacterium]